MTTKLFVAGLLLLLLTAGPAYPQNKDILRLEADMIMLQQQVKQLQTSVDENNGAIKGLVEKIADQVNTLAGGLQRVSQAVDGMKGQNDTTSRDVRTDLRTIVTTLTTLNSTVNDLQEGLSSVRAQVNSLAQQMTAMKNTTAVPLATADDLWRSAQLDYLAGNYDLAISGYMEFLSKFPNDPRAPEAHLRMGEALVNQKKIEPGEAEFDFVLQKYPESDTTRAALLKKGLALAEHDKSQAITTLKEVVMRFPNTSEATTAQTKLRELQQPPARQRPAR